MRPLLAAVALLAALPALAAPTTVRQDGARWVVENAALRVTVDPVPGRIAVLDKRSRYEWRQPDAEGGAPARLPLRRATAPPAVDGDLAEWRTAPTVRLSSRMTTADGRKVDGDADCSADVWCAWDADSLYVAARVRDDVLRWGGPGLADWWQRDSLELWIGGRQVGLRLDPAGSGARTLDGPVPGARVVCRPLAAGYAVEAAIPWDTFPDAPARRPGSALRFAIGVNDADAAGAREGQLYFPASWAHSQPSTFAEASLVDEAGALPAERPAASPLFRAVRRAPDGIAFEADFGATNGQPNTVTVTLRLPARSADLAVEADVADRAAPRTSFPFLAPFVLDTPDGVLAVADYCDGHLYPLGEEPFPRTWFDAGRLDLPMVGVCDLRKGPGYALILETSDDAWVQCRPDTVGARRLYAPQVGWLASKGAFGYTRRLLYRFAPTGGYVALARAYRAYAQARGLIVPFSQKVKRNPNIRRLFGAPDVWGDASLAFAREARALGIDKMLIHGRSAPAEMRAVNALGYLSSEYDNYTDILPVEPGQAVDSSHDLLPDHAVLNADGKRMAAWLTYDKKTQYMKRCPALWAPTARLVIPALLKTYPLLGRFIDVTTAEGPYECFDPAHPLTRAQKRECGEALLAAVRSNGLVVGGEHGIWWGVPHQDYVEGMMSGNRFAWPAGHLIHPRDRQEKFAGPYGTETWDVYDRWSMGHAWRVPLWELVFHDCVVTTWYWGDSNDYLHDASPEVQAKKDAFNILYGTMPMLWADAQGGWRKDRAGFLRTYRSVCRLHEVVAGAEMVSHEFVTADHAVQRTRFSNGTVCLVNFGAAPQRVSLAGRTYLLPQNGFAVKGPGIEQSRAVSGGTVRTVVRQPGYLSEEDSAGRVLTARSRGAERLRLQCSGGRRLTSFQPQQVRPDWDLATTRTFALDSEGRRLRQLTVVKAGDALRLQDAAEGGIELVCGRAARAPDLQIDGGDVSPSPSAVRQGEPARVRVIVRNLGGTAVQAARVALYADMVRPDRLLAARVLAVPAGAARTVSFTVGTARLDGPRRLVAAAAPLQGVAELCDRNNTASCRLTVAPDFARWPRRQAVGVEAGAVDRDSVMGEYHLQDASLDPASVRVVACGADGRPVAMVPSQCERVAPGTWRVVFAAPGLLPAGGSRRLLVLWAPAGGPRFLPAGGSMWDAAAQTITAATYSARLVDGTLRDVGPAGKPCISHMMFSSAETGWTEEPGTVRQLDVLADGPVRTVVHVRKELLAGVVTDKTYTFYPDRFELAGSVNKPIGVFSRSYYVRPGQYEDSGGFRAVIDGQGDAEDVSGRARSPEWYCVYAADWSHTCVALSPAGSITYWDNPGAWGGTGFSTAGGEGIRLAYVFHPGASTAAFAAEDARRVREPVRVVAE